jgi:hypothetical protein
MVNFVFLYEFVYKSAILFVSQKRKREYFKGFKLKNLRLSRQNSLAVSIPPVKIPPRQYSIILKFPKIGNIDGEILSRKSLK